MMTPRISFVRWSSSEAKAALVVTTLSSSPPLSSGIWTSCPICIRSRVTSVRDLTDRSSSIRSSRVLVKSLKRLSSMRYGMSPAPISNDATVIEVVDALEEYWLCLHELVVLVGFGFQYPHLIAEERIGGFEIIEFEPGALDDAMDQVFWPRLAGRAVEFD